VKTVVGWYFATVTSQQFVLINGHTINGISIRHTSTNLPRQLFW